VSRYFSDLTVSLELIESPPSPPIKVGRESDDYGSVVYAIRDMLRLGHARFLFAHQHSTLAGPVQRVLLASGRHRQQMP